MSSRSSRKNPPLASAESPVATSSESLEDFNPRAADDEEIASPKRSKKSSKSTRKTTAKSDDEEDEEIEPKPDSVAVDLQAHSRRSRRKAAEPDITTAAQEESEDSSEGANPKPGVPRGSAKGSSSSKPEEMAYEDELEPRTTKEKIVWRLRYCCWGLFETLSCSYLNVFLALAPFVYLSVAFNWPQEAVFTLDILAIMSHAAMMKFAWMMVAKEWIHPAVEKSVHMVFRNGPVLILAIFALIRNVPRLAQGIIFGVILNRLTVVLGLAFLFGWKEEKRKLEGKTIKIASTFVLVVLFAILTPSFFAASTSAQSGDEGLVRMSRWVAILLALGCIIYSLFNLKTHPKFHEDVDHGYIAELGRVGSIVVLAIVVGLLCGAGWFLAGSFETVSQRWGLTYGFLSYIIIPTVINAIDMTETVRLMNQMPTKSNVIISGLLRSIIEMCLFTGPFLVLLAWIMNKPLGFDAYPFEGGVTFISALIVHFIMADARSNWLLGGLIIFLYSILGVAFFFQPDL